MVPTEFVLQPPVVRIRHGTVAEMIGRLSSQPLGLGGKVRRLSSMVRLPELHRFSEQTAQTIAEAATSPSLGLDHLTDRAQHVGQTFLLLHPRQSLSIVAPSSIRYHHPSIVRGHHLTHLFVAVTSTNLVHRSLIRFERHQKSRPAVHSPSRVVGVDEWTGTHRTPQLMVGVPHCTPGTSQRVLADRPLAQLHTSQRSEHSGDLPYRNAHSIVERVGRRHHSSPYPVRAGPVLVWRNIGMPPSDLLTAGPAPTYLHPVPRHLGSGNRRNVGCVDNPHSLMLESASTSGAGVLSHRHLYKRLGDFIGRRQLSVAERPHTRLAAGTLGSAASPTLGERSRLALSCSLELGDLLVQLFVGRRQLRNLPLQLRDQPHQLVALRGREAFGLTHSQSIKTCSVLHNPPTDADPANQLLQSRPRSIASPAIACLTTPTAPDPSTRLPNHPIESHRPGPRLSSPACCPADPAPAPLPRTAIGAPNDNQRPPPAPSVGIERGPSRPTALTPCSNPKAAPHRWIRGKRERVCRIRSYSLSRCPTQTCGPTSPFLETPSPLPPATPGSAHGLTSNPVLQLVPLRP